MADVESEEISAGSPARSGTAGVAHPTPGKTLRCAPRSALPQIASGLKKDLRSKTLCRANHGNAVATLICEMKTMFRTVCVNMRRRYRILCKENNYLCVGYEILHEVTSARFDRRRATCW